MAEKHFEDSLNALVRETKSGPGGSWEGTMRDYMGLVHDNPRIAQLAPGRIFDMLLEKGTAEITGFEKLPHFEDEVKYNFSGSWWKVSSSTSTWRRSGRKPTRPSWRRPTGGP